MWYVCELGCFCVQQFLDFSFSWESITSDKHFYYYCHYDCYCRSCAPCHWFMKYHDVRVLPHHPSDHHRNLYLQHPQWQNILHHKRTKTLAHWHQNQPRILWFPAGNRNSRFFPNLFNGFDFLHFHPEGSISFWKKTPGELPTFGSPTSKIAGQESLVRVYNRLANRQEENMLLPFEHWIQVARITTQMPPSMGEVPKNGGQKCQVVVILN